MSATYTLRDNGTEQVTEIACNGRTLAVIAADLAAETDTVRTSTYVKGPGVTVTLLVADYGTPQGRNAYVLTETRQTTERVEDPAMARAANTAEWVGAALDHGDI